MNELVAVGLGELKATDNSSVLASFGLGSCVAVAMYDPFRRLGALAHVMLPESRGRDSEAAPGKYADTAVPRLVEALERMGGRKGTIRCKIAGGSHMFKVSAPAGGVVPRGYPESMRIGARNIEAVKRALEELRIPLVAEDTGGSHGRTVLFRAGSGEVEVTSISLGKKSI